jgi:hypothetical protein
MKKKQIDVVVIFCMVGNAKLYMASASKRFDRKIVPQFNADHLMAFRCEDEGHAADTIRQIHNSNNKTFHTEWITVDQEPVVKLGSLVTRDALV